MKWFAILTLILWMAGSTCAWAGVRTIKYFGRYGDATSTTNEDWVAQEDNASIIVGSEVELKATDDGAPIIRSGDKTNVSVSISSTGVVDNTSAGSNIYAITAVPDGMDIFNHGTLTAKSTNGGTGIAFQGSATSADHFYNNGGTVTGLIDLGGGGDYFDYSGGKVETVKGGGGSLTIWSNLEGIDLFKPVGIAGSPGLRLQGADGLVGEFLEFESLTIGSGSTIGNGQYIDHLQPGVPGWQT